MIQEAEGIALRFFLINLILTLQIIENNSPVYGRMHLNRTPVS